MRRSLAAGVAVVAALSLVGTAAASAPAKKKPPVKLSGKVTDKGTAKVKNGAITVEQDDFYFKPTYIQGKKGEDVTVTVKNEGSVQHTFTIDSQNVDKTVDPGKSVTVMVKIPANGKPVAGHCRFHGADGMKFAFFSKAGATAKSTSSDSGKSGYGY
jgi:plastocyanin